MIMGNEESQEDCGAQTSLLQVFLQQFSAKEAVQKHYNDDIECFNKEYM